MAARWNSSPHLTGSIGCIGGEPFRLRAEHLNNWKLVVSDLAAWLYLAENDRLVLAAFEGACMLVRDLAREIVGGCIGERVDITT
jgi:GT2 family glycosyltransferase